jgi:membrane-bound lytic murein transglycosylase B
MRNAALYSIIILRRSFLCLVCGLCAGSIALSACLPAKAARKKIPLESYGRLLELPAADPEAGKPTGRPRPKAESAAPPAGENSVRQRRPGGLAAGAPSPVAPDPAWMALIDRLEADGFDRRELETVFAGLGPRSYSPAYMANKIAELYGVGGIGINREGSVPPALPENYEQPLSDATVGSCLAFIAQYAFDLADIEDRYGVPARVIIAILLVETNLGLDLGSDAALRALASMAATSTPELLGQRGNAGQARRVRAASLRATLKAKSDWAYEEVKALIRYAGRNGADPGKIPGSIYGAIGICQFMPSNSERYGVDGDKDGKVDLFSPRDAMYSVANYLEANGWREATTNARQFEVIKTYNQDNFYAARVLGVANRIGRAIAGKVPTAHNALAGIDAAPPYALDPSLRRIRRYGAKMPGLGNYQGLLPP